MDKNNHRIIDLTAEDIVAWYVTDRESVQSTAGANCGRELTDTEMKRMECAFLENDEASDSIMTALIAAIEDAMDNSKGQWDSFDAEAEKDTEISS